MLRGWIFTEIYMSHDRLILPICLTDVAMYMDIKMKDDNE